MLLSLGMITTCRPLSRQYLYVLGSDTNIIQAISLQDGSFTTNGAATLTTQPGGPKDGQQEAKLLFGAGRYLYAGGGCLRGWCNLLWFPVSCLLHPVSCAAQPEPCSSEKLVLLAIGRARLWTYPGQDVQRSRSEQYQLRTVRHAAQMPLQRRADTCSRQMLSICVVKIQPEGTPGHEYR